MSKIFAWWRTARLSVDFDSLLAMKPVERRGGKRYMVVAVLGLAAVFTFDLITPLGVADGMLYALVVLIGLGRPEQSFVLSLAAASTILTLLGWALSPPAPEVVSGNVVMMNRTLSLAVIWGAGFAVLRSGIYERGFHVIAQAVEQAPAGVVITDTGGTIVYVNSAVTRLSGRAQDELVGDSPRVFASGQTPRESYENLWRTIASGRTWEGEILNRRKDGAFVWEHEIITPVRDSWGSITHYIGVKEDVTARKKLEEQLRFARLAAEEANQSKSSFLANMSHELRTPLNAILGFSEAVKMGIPAPLTHPKHVEYIGLIHQSAGHLLQLINDILDLSKIESGAQTLQEARICLPDVLETCVRMVRERADRKNIRLDVDVGDDCPGLTADERMIKQIVLNLLTNAIKFTPNGGVVSIGVALDGGGLAVRVADSGVGIGPEDMRRVFTPFARAEGDPYVRGQEGTGLGLVLTRKMVDMHGGALTLDSVPGTGTTATVRFPASRLAPLADSA